VPAWTFTISGTGPTPSLKPWLRSVAGATGDAAPRLTAATVSVDPEDGTDVVVDEWTTSWPAWPPRTFEAPPGAVPGRSHRSPLESFMAHLSAAQARHPSRWQSFGSFLQAVKRAARPDIGPKDNRLEWTVHAAAGAPSQEADGGSGGYAVPPDFRVDLAQRLTAEESLLNLCTRVETTSNVVAVPGDFQPPWASTGILAQFTPEGAADAENKLALALRTVRLAKTIVSVEVTDELMEDAAVLERFVRQTAGDRLVWTFNRELLNGSGPSALRVLNAPALITTAKETGQTAGTVVHLNLSKSWASLYPSSKRKDSTVWVASPTAEAQIQELVSPVQAPTLVYDPATGVPRIFGARVIVSSAAQPVGTPGDVCLVDFSQVLAVTRPGVTKQDLSMDVYFDQGVNAFRFTTRWAAIPLWSAAVTDWKGGASLSPSVVIATR